MEETDYRTHSSEGMTNLDELDHKTQIKIRRNDEFSYSNPKSPPQFTGITFIATLSARSHVNQKFINKYEAYSFPSQEELK